MDNNYIDKRLESLESQLSGRNTPTNYKSREQQLEEENRILRQQLTQQSNIDPMLAEFRNSNEHQAARKDNFLTYLWCQFFPSWKNSEQGKAFEDWEKSTFEEYKKRKMTKTQPQMQTMTQPQYTQQNYTQGAMNNGIPNQS